MILIVENKYSFLEEILEFLEKRGIVFREIIEFKVENCYDDKRRQYSAECIFEEISKKIKDIFLFITDKNMYADDLNFVFGIAKPFRGAIVSIYMLRGDKFLNRVKKEVLHELGHVMGLSHCKNYCVMRFSNSVAEVDEKPSHFCEKCERKFEYGKKLLFMFGFL